MKKPYFDQRINGEIIHPDDQRIDGKVEGKIIWLISGSPVKSKILSIWVINGSTVSSHFALVVRLMALDPEGTF